MLALKDAFLASLSTFTEILIKLSIKFFGLQISISKLHTDSGYHGMLSLQELYSSRLCGTHILETQKLENAFIS